MQLSPDYSWAYYNLGAIAYELDDITNAILYLKQTINFNPTDIEAYKILNKIYLKQNRFDDAIELIKTALESIPQNGDLYYNYAQIFKLQGELDKYQRALSTALSNKETLTYPLNLVQKEFKTINKQLGETELKVSSQKSATITEETQFSQENQNIEQNINSNSTFEEQGQS
ncbi:MAG: tetratricopeptide repeat protein [Candidatus Gastranaerophilaceae bacterium]